WQGQRRKKEVTTRRQKQRLPPSSQPGCQSWRKLGLEYELLRALQVIRNTTERNDTFVAVKDRESGAPIAVARFSHGSGIDHVSHVRLQGEINDFTLAHGSIHRAKCVVHGMIIREASLQMGVTEERVHRGRNQQRSASVEHRNHILIFINR